MSIGVGYFWTELRKRIDNKIAERTMLIIKGTPTDYQSYHDQVVFIASLNWVLEQARDIFGEKKAQPPEETEED